MKGLNVQRWGFKLQNQNMETNIIMTHIVLTSRETLRWVLLRWKEAVLLSYCLGYVIK